MTERIQGEYLRAQARKEFNDRANLDKHMLDFEKLPSYQPGDWQQQFLDDQGFGEPPGNLRDLSSASGRVTAQTWLLGDTLKHGFIPMLSETVNSITPADIAFGEMYMGYDDLQWVSNDTLKGLTANAAAMSGGVTPWATSLSEEVRQRILEIQAAAQRSPAARQDAPPGGRNSGGVGVAWDEGLDLYQRTSGETAENIAWIRTRPDDRAESGPNVGWTFKRIVEDAVRESGLVPEFAMGGIVPGSIGAPVPAVVHGGERVLGDGSTGGIPMNLEVHVHGTVISEGDLANNVRNGLMRRLS